MLYKRDEVDTIRKAAVLLWEKGLLANLDSLIRTLESYTVDLDWKEEWAFNAHHYTSFQDEYTFFINGLPGNFRCEVHHFEKVIFSDRRRSVADCEEVMLEQIQGKI